MVQRILRHLYNLNSQYSMLNLSLFSRHVPGIQKPMIEEDLALQMEQDRKLQQELRTNPDYSGNQGRKRNNSDMETNQIISMWSSMFSLLFRDIRKNTHSVSYSVKFILFLFSSVKRTIWLGAHLQSSHRNLFILKLEATQPFECFFQPLQRSWVNGFRVEEAANQ